MTWLICITSQQTFMNYTNAFVKPPAETYASALTMEADPRPVDLALARQQHFAYVTQLRQLGLSVTELAPDPRFPDSCFVQDVAFVCDGQLIVTRPGADSRRGEPEAMMDALTSISLPMQTIFAPATLDGGDVMLTEDKVYVGLSERTNAQAVEQLRGMLKREVIAVPLPAGLHLLSSCTYLGDERILVTPECSEVQELVGFEQFVLPPQEAYAANVLVLGKDVVMPAGFLLAASQLEDAGFTLHLLDMSEFEKRDGGVTCLSLLY
jgi:dimethylargininase